MFASIKRRAQEVATIAALCSAAEKHACAAGQQQPGAEHFLLAAFDLPDGAARRVFDKIGADPKHLDGSIERQYKEALQGMGIELPALDEPAQTVAPTKGVYRAQPSGEAVMQRLAEQRTSQTPLSSAHVVLAVVSSEHGVVARALRSMGIDREQLMRAARAEIEALAVG